MKEKRTVAQNKNTGKAMKIKLSDVATAQQHQLRRNPTENGTVKAALCRQWDPVGDTICRNINCQHGLQLFGYLKKGGDVWIFY